MGPSELHEEKIPLGSFALNDFIFAAKPFTDGGYKNTLSTFLSFIGAVLSQPVRRYTDEAAMLANENLAPNHLAYLTTEGVLYLYNGPDADDIDNYTFLVGGNPNRGDMDGSGGVLPSTGGSRGGAPVRGDHWRLSVGGNFGTIDFPAGTVLEFFGTDPATFSHWRFY